jgi:hypothetical protein
LLYVIGSLQMRVLYSYRHNYHNYTHTHTHTHRPLVHALLRRHLYLQRHPAVSAQEHSLPTRGLFLRAGAGDHAWALRQIHRLVCSGVQWECATGGCIYDV